MGKHCYGERYVNAYLFNEYFVFVSQNNIQSRSTIFYPTSSKVEEDNLQAYILIDFNFGYMSSEKSAITLTWNGLCAEVKGKPLLTNCSGYCKPGEMLAIMGASGAGKTTLLSTLSMKADPQLSITGQVLANNSPFTYSSFFDFGVFVYQDDTLYENLTVRQTLRFTAVLKYNNPEEAERRVDELIRTFELQKCEQAFVGGKVKRGISGGEKKRVCIAVEMISRPSLLVLDQPTSGLDSHKAGSVVKVLKRLAEQGCTIIFTIHQPSYLLYSMLTNLILLDKGHTIYQGKAQQIGNYINELGVAIPTHSTISDFFIWEISEFKSAKDNYTTPLHKDNYTLRIEPAICRELAILKEGPAGFPVSHPVTTFLFMFMTLFRRELIMFIRNPMKFVGGVLNAIVGIIIVGVFYLNEIPSSDELIAQGAVSEYATISYRFLGIQGVSFINITSMIMSGIFAVQIAFSVDRQIYYKDSSSKKYYPIAYFLAKTTIQFLGSGFSCVLFGAASYWINGFDPVFSKFIKFILSLLLMTLCGNSLGFVIGAMFKDQNQAAAIGPLVTLPLMAFSGLYNKLSDIPAWISWLAYISPFRYGLHLILENEYGDLKIGLIDGSNYDYQSDLGIDLSFYYNVLVSAGLAFGFYLMSFILLKRLSSSLSS